MFTNKFKEGMAKGAEPFEEKFKKQEKKINKVADSLQNKLNGIDEVIDKIIDIEEEHDEILKNMNNEKKFNIKDEIKVDELEDTEKEFLAGLIATLVNTISNENKLNENQQKYIQSIWKYLGFICPPRGIQISTIENIDNLEKQKIILKVLMEIMFLKEGNFDFIKNFDYILEYFSVNKKAISNIKESILLLYNAIGVEGISQMYDLNDTFRSDANNLMEDVNENNKDNLNEADHNMEKTEFDINKNMNVEKGEHQAVTNKIIYINDTIYIKGTLLLENCEIRCGNKMISIIEYDERGFIKNTAKHKNGTRYDDDGFDKYGYDKYGNKKDSLNAENNKYMKSKKPDLSKYDERGFIKYTTKHKNGTKYDDNGFDKYGYDKCGYDINGFNRDGYYRNGTKYDDKGFDKYGNSCEM